jgi:hypothetical protein
MRAPRRHRPLPRSIGPVPIQVDLGAVAARVQYEGSPEHKDARSFAGQPRPRADASICDRSLADRQSWITGWLRTGILNGHVSEYWEGDFPRYVWYRDEAVVYEGRLMNREAGTYKGYPLEIDEWPAGI